MLWLVLVIAAWGIVHSMLASLRVKDYAARILGPSAWRVYRISYNLFSLITFAPILLLVRSLPDRLLYAVQSPWVYLMLAGQGAAVLCLAATLLQTDVASFIGLRQIFAPEGPPRLVVDGFYRWVRHPLYLFGLLALWLTPHMTLNMLVADVSLTAYICIGAVFEERKLDREFGAVYAEYKSRTPMIIPLRLPAKNPVLARR